MIPQTWKNIERKVAGFFGGFRVPLSGMNSGHNTHADVIHPDYYIEIKHGKKYKTAQWFIPNCLYLINNQQSFYSCDLIDSYRYLKTISPDASRLNRCEYQKELYDLLFDTLTKATMERKKSAILVIHPLGLHLQNSWCFISHIDYGS